MQTKIKGSPGKFTDQDFTATKFATAADKAKFANKMTRFILGNFQQSAFSKMIYQRISNMFGHIAHYDIHGFYFEWFEDKGKCIKWIENMTSNWLVGMGDPKHTWSDVEKALVQWVKDNHIREQLDALIDESEPVLELTTPEMIPVEIEPTPALLSASSSQMTFFDILNSPR